jgi:3-hydroxyacyl-[acyl-carrier-protein] dehydratase
MLDVREIMKHLPHRYPFLLIDRVLEIERNASIAAIKNVTMNEQFFQGHFPGEPIMPGVLIVEAMAQAAGILAIASRGEKNSAVYFMSIEGAKFRKPVVPGDQLRFEIKVLRERGPVWKVAALAKVDDKVVSEAELTAMLGTAKEG